VGDVDGAYLSTHTLSSPAVVFATEAAAQVPLADDIRQCTRLWAMRWGPSPYVFLHRKDSKRFAFALFSGRVTLPVLLQKKAAAGVPSDVTARADGELDLSAFARPGLSRAMLSARLLVETSVAQVALEAEFSAALTAPPTSVQLDRVSVADAVSGRQTASAAQEVDVMQDLREEIACVVRAIAREYVTLYPLSPAHPSEAGFSLAARKADFFHFLSASAKYHALKESLKPKIQRVVRHR
jgi:hypothetical protein